MFNVKLDFSDVLARINAIGNADLARTIANAVADEAVIPEMAKEPFRTRPYKKMIFTSARQRAFVIAGIRSGAITVPYQRTGKIGMTTKTADGSGVSVTDTAPYSDYVRTAGKQAAYHAGLWLTDEMMARSIEADTAELIGTAAVLAALEKAGLT